MGIASWSSREALQRRLDLGVGPEGAGLLAQDEVVAHAAGGRGPDPVHVLGARRLEVEVPRPVVAALLDRVDGPERAAGVAGTEAQVLVEAGTVLTVEVEVEELAVPERLGDAVGVVEPGHLLVPDLGVEADEFGVLELVDEGESVADGGEQDVAARLVRLGLEGEPEVVALLEDVVAEDVEGLLVAVEGGPDVLGRTGLGTLAAAPGDERRGAELDGEVDVVGDLADGEPAYVAVVVGEAAVAKDGMGEQVRRHHRHDEAGVGERLAERSEVVEPLLGASHQTG